MLGKFFSESFRKLNFNNRKPNDKCFDAELSSRGQRQSLILKIINLCVIERLFGTLWSPCLGLSGLKWEYFVPQNTQFPSESLRDSLAKILKCFVGFKN